MTLPAQRVLKAFIGKMRLNLSDGFLARDRGRNRD
jgi:hypothetical protein